MRMVERTEKLRVWLSEPISGQSLAVLRILFGAILVWDYFRYVEAFRIERYYVAVPVNFPYFGLDFIKPLPEPWIHWAWAVMGISAALVALGLFFRVAIIVFIVSFGYFFLLDRVQYLNHNYMVLIYAFLLSLSPANRVWSLDALLRRGDRSQWIPRWPVVAIKLQTEIILVFAGLVKITDDWLRGQPLLEWLPPKQDNVIFGALFQNDYVIIAGAWFVVALHIIGAPLLMYRKTRLPVFLIYATFHVSNAALFNIGIFPWLTIAVTLIFFDPDWPSQLWHRIRALFGSSAQPASATRDAAPPTFRPIRTGLLSVLAIWFAIQIFLPLRQGFFPNLVGWTGDGQRFSWRMRVYDNLAKGGYLVVNPATGEEQFIDPSVPLGPRGANYVMSRPDLSREFALWLEHRFVEVGGWPDAEVYARYTLSFNHRPPQDFIDPAVDLTETTRNFLRPDPWIMPLETRASEGRLPDWFPPLPLQKP